MYWYLLVDRVVRACRREGIRNVVVSGGVACNERLRRAFGETALREDLAVHFPSPQYTTDNAAMIAAAGFLHLDRKRFASSSLGARASLPL